MIFSIEAASIFKYWPGSVPKILIQNSLVPCVQTLSLSWRREKMVQLLLLVVLVPQGAGNRIELRWMDRLREVAWGREHFLLVWEVLLECWHSMPNTSREFHASRWHCTGRLVWCRTRDRPSSHRWLGPAWEKNTVTKLECENLSKTLEMLTDIDVCCMFTNWLAAWLSRLGASRQVHQRAPNSAIYLSMRTNLNSGQIGRGNRHSKFVITEIRTQSWKLESDLPSCWTVCSISIFPAQRRTKPIPSQFFKPRQSASFMKLDKSRQF